MAGPIDPKVLAQEIKLLSETGVARVVRLSPEVGGAFAALVAKSADKAAVNTAVERYLLAASRLQKHNDPGVRALFIAADDALAAHVKAATGRDIELLARELAQRRITVLADPSALQAELEKAAAKRSAQAVGTGLIDAGAARLHAGFFDRLRSIAALGSAQWTASQRLLMVARRKLFRVIGGQWTAGWEACFTYVRQNAVAIAARADELRAARSALQQAQAAANPAAVAAAEAVLTKARQRTGGFVSKIKGLLGEAYVPRWESWNIQMESLVEIAGREAARLPGKWQVRRVVGNLRIDGKEAWDEAILLIRLDRRPAEAKLFAAAQYKVEKEVSALGQIENDVIRETAHNTKPPILTIDGEDDAFLLTPLTAGQTGHRFLLNAAGGAVRASAIAKLRAAGINVNQLNLDISNAELDEMAELIMEIVADTLR